MESQVGRKVPLIGAMLATLAASWATAAETTFSLPQDDPPLHVAVIADSQTDPRLAILEAALVNAMGAAPDLRMVERQEIVRILQERALSASQAADPGTALRVGRLCSADALVVLRTEVAVTNQCLRLLVLDVRTGIHLDDSLADLGVAASGFPPLVMRLEQAIRKLRVPMEQRHFVGFLGLHSEETGSGLDAATRILGLLLEQDLNLCTNVTILDRTLVQRLVEEEGLTGVELQIKAAAILIEGALRRDGAHQTLTASFRLSAPARQSAESVTATAPNDNLPAMRMAILDAIRSSASLTGVPLKSEPISPAEVDQLAAYAARMLSFGQTDRALALAETALAMQTNEVAMAVARDAHMALSLSRDLDRCTQVRHRVLANHYNRQWVEGKVQAPGGLGDWPVPYHFERYGLWALRLEPRSPEINELVRELEQEWVPALHLALQDMETRATSMRALDMALAYRLMFVESMSATPAVMQQEVQAVLTRFERDFISRYPRHEGFNVYSRLHFVVRDDSSRHKWTTEGRLAVLTWLAEHPETTYQIIGYEGMTFLKDPGPRADAAKQVLRLAIDPAIQAHRGTFDDNATWRAAVVLAETGKAAAFFDDVINKAETLQDPLALAAYAPVFDQVMEHVPLTQKAALCRRMWAVLASDKTETNTVLRLREKVRSLLPADNAGDTPPSPPPSDAGPWGQYTVEPIRLNGIAAEHGVIVHLQGQPGGTPDEVMVIWETPATGTLFTVVDIETGGVRNLGRLGPTGRARGRSGRLEGRSAGDAELFFYSNGEDLQVVRDGTVRTFTEADGLPNRVIERMAFAGDALVMVHPGAISLYEPATDRIDMLISYRSMNPRCALDGPRQYDIFDLTADRLQSRVLIAVRAWEPDLVGLWSYDTRSGTFAHLPGRLIANELYWEGDNLHLVVGGHLFRLDTSRTNEPTGPYAKIGYFSEIQPGPHVMLGNHVIHASGYLNTLDRKMVRIGGSLGPRWTVIARHGSEAIAAKGNVLWRIRRRTL